MKMNRIRCNHVQSLKEVGRHALFMLGVSRVAHLLRGRSASATDHFGEATLGERFRAIYDRKIWVQKKGQESLSGLGSELISTVGIRNELPKILARLGCRRLVDVGCGDWTWMRHVPLECDYIGLDVVPSVISANRIFERDGVSFEVLDAVREALPKADVMLCREVLFHLSFADGCRLIANMKRAADCLLLTTDTSIWFNSDIESGDFRLLNLEQRPYLLPPPNQVIWDEAVADGRLIGVWPVTEL